MNEQIENLAFAIVDPIKMAEENMKKNCYLGYGSRFLGIYYRRPVWKRLSKDKGIGAVLLRIYNHPHEKKHDILKAVNLTAASGEITQILRKGEMVSWTRKTHYKITPLGVAVLRKFNLI